MACLSSDTSYITFLVSFPQTAFHALFDYRSIYSYISRLISLVLSPVPIHHSLSILYRYYSHCLIASLYVSSLEIASRGLRRTPLLLLLLGVVIAPPPRRPFPSATRLRFLDRSVRQPRLSDHTFVLQQWCINLHLRVYCLLGSPSPSAKPQPRCKRHCQNHTRSFISLLNLKLWKLPRPGFWLVLPERSSKQQTSPDMSFLGPSVFSDSPYLIAPPGGLSGSAY